DQIAHPAAGSRRKLSVKKRRSCERNICSQTGFNDTGDMRPFDLWRPSRWQFDLATVANRAEQRASRKEASDSVGASDWENLVLSSEVLKSRTGFPASVPHGPMPWRRCPRGCLNSHSNHYSPSQAKTGRGVLVLICTEVYVSVSCHCELA